MRVTVSSSTKKRLLLAVSGGVAAGFLNGLLGAGGGILLMYIFSFLNPDRSPEGVRDNFAVTVAAVLPVTLFSAYLYTQDGRVDLASVSPLILPALLGGITGALLLDRLPTGLLKKIFALLVVYSGFRMLFR